MYIATGIGCKRLYCVGHRRHGAILYGVVEYINPAIHQQYSAASITYTQFDIYIYINRVAVNFISGSCVNNFIYEVSNHTEMST